DEEKAAKESAQKAEADAAAAAETAKQAADTALLTAVTKISEGIDGLRGDLGGLSDRVNKLETKDRARKSSTNVPERSGGGGMYDSVLPAFSKARQAS